MSKHRQVYTQGGEVGEEPLGPGGVSTRRKKETQKGGRRWKRRRAAKAKGSAEKELGQMEKLEESILFLKIIEMFLYIGIYTQKKTKMATNGEKQSTL